MKNAYILSIDQGTTSSRAIIFNELGQQVGAGQLEFPQYFPHEGWVEHNAEEIWQTTLRVCELALDEANIHVNQLNGIGITNQRETTLVWNRETGEVIYRAIVWQDRRTAALCQKLKQAGKESIVSEKTGLLLDPYFSATKIAWILDNVENARNLANSGKLCFGTVDSFLIWRLTKGRQHLTDATNASRTMLFNIHTQKWDQELLEFFGIPLSMMPEVKNCADDFGVTDETVLGARIPIAGVAGDQQAALIGQACFEEGMAKSTYGTGCFLILNTGNRPVQSQHKLLTTIAYRLDEKVTYGLEGSIFVAGAVVQWLRDGVKLIKHASDSEAFASKAGYRSDVIFVPAFTGLGAPYWDPEARGAITGITRDTGVEEIVSAALMSVGLQTVDLLKAMAKDGAQFPRRLRIDGGMVRNNWLVQSLADFMQVEVDRPSNVETTALGVAYLAGLQLGVFESLDQISQLWQKENSFIPQIDKLQAELIYEKWCAQVKKVLTLE